MALSPPGRTVPRLSQHVSNLQNQDETTISRPSLLTIPVEVRQLILNELLSTSYNYQPHTHSCEPETKESYEAKMAKTKHQNLYDFRLYRWRSGLDSESAVSPSSCSLYPSILGTCRQLCNEGRGILYGLNHFIAITASLSYLQGPFSEYGCQLWSVDSADRKLPSEAFGQPRPVPVMGISFQITENEADEDGSDQTSRQAVENGTYLVCVEDLRAVILFFCSDSIDFDMCQVSFSTRSHPALPVLGCNNAKSVSKLVGHHLLPYLWPRISFLTEEQTKALGVSRQYEIGSALQIYSSLDASFTSRCEVVCTHLEKQQLDIDAAVDHRPWMRLEEDLEHINFQAGELAADVGMYRLEDSRVDEVMQRRISRLWATTAFSICQLHTGRIRNRVDCPEDPATTRAILAGMMALRFQMPEEHQDQWLATISLCLCLLFVDKGDAARSVDYLHKSADAVGLSSMGHPWYCWADVPIDFKMTLLACSSDREGLVKVIEKLEGLAKEKWDTIGSGKGQLPRTFQCCPIAVDFTNHFRYTFR